MKLLSALSNFLNNLQKSPEILNRIYICVSLVGTENDELFCNKNNQIYKLWLNPMLKK